MDVAGGTLQPGYWSRDGRWIYFGGGKEMFEDLYHANGIHSIFCGMIAPEASGMHRGQWTMFAPDGTPFGTRPFMQIQVP